ncbi:MAG: helix-turn-helix domain-containing protein [Patescibacteria group bacterium]
MEHATFKEFLQEYIDIKGLSLKKLSDSTGVPERYIESLLESNYDALPPAPYIRGYILKLSTVLDFDKEEMWRLYKKESGYHSSGAFDKLPSNRFAIKKLNKKLAVYVGLGLILIIYLGLNFNKLLGAPELEITYPLSANLIVQEPLVSIEGLTDAGNKVTINGEELFVDKGGRFQKEYALDPGLNTLDIVASKFLGKEITTTKKIIYQKPIIEKVEENINVIPDEIGNPTQ